MSFKASILHNKVPPKRIVFFCDGLSEGEHNVVGKEDIEDI